MNGNYVRYRLLCTTTFFLFFLIGANAQKKKVSFKDSLDSKMDLSDYIIEANGFVPVPYLITEPALGGFGGALFPIFIKKNPPYRDSVKGKLQITPVAPNVTGGGGLYTVNNTWGTFGFRSGTFVKSRIKYLIGGGYFHVNISFYKTFEQVGEKELQFTLDVAPFIVQATRRLGFSHWYAGFRYSFLSNKVSFRGDTSLKRFADSIDGSQKISQLGMIVEMDRRDNIFTPDKGLKLHFDVTRSDEAIGSDHEFWKMNYYGYGYYLLSNNLIGGLRIDGKQAFGDIPFYMLPFIEMRGVPAVRYQGKANLLSETEMRWDVQRRWSLMLFGGAAKAFDDWNEFGNVDWIFTYGTGVRYLLARKFKLRVGVDVAHGPGTWAYYIVFGSNWLK
jgi:hypothetical protein